jgi:hypothetical protein
MRVPTSQLFAIGGAVVIVAIVVVIALMGRNCAGALVKRYL